GDAPVPGRPGAPAGNASTGVRIRPPDVLAPCGPAVFETLQSGCGHRRVTGTKAFFSRSDRHADQPGPARFVFAGRRMMPDVATIALGHLDRMTDSTGLIQHAIYSIPRRESGY